ncbi:transmembrane protein 237-like [Mytilus edulis]|uniref:Transmembrane protein 237 n=2 Tax=Mytilus TaxID=6548 RepID=A0A8B6G4R8_MYTGA|nr:TMEM237 [Mytilus edulis]VDI58528.1 Hypothetical predicted protein [Mytilus galloprovincialis]
MADNENPPKKKKLPPVTQASEETDVQKRPVRKKKKKPTEATENGETGSTATTPKKKKAPVATEDGDKPTPRKRKKRKPPEQAEDGQPTSARSAASQEEVGGSKTSLISKDDKKTTPKKKVKKKVKKASPRVGDEFMDAAFAADLSTIQEDIVTPDGKKDEDVIPHPYSTESIVLKSQPLDNLFIETNSGFKRENKTKLARKWAEEERFKQEDQPEGPVSSTIEFAISTHNVFKTFCLFIHGLTAGIAMWHITTVYVLLYHSDLDFLSHYRPLALPVQCMFYILLVLCTISSCDRFDIANPTRRFLLRSFTLQTGTVSIVIYFAALILSLSIANIEDRMNLYNRYPDLWLDPGETSSKIELWTNINTARGCLIILAWIVLSITSTTDRLGQMLKEGDDFIIGDTVELANPA